MEERWAPYPGSNLKRALYVTRLRQTPLSISRKLGHTWRRHRYTVGDRARDIAERLPQPLKFNPHGLRRWQPGWGRESPRSEWMSWRTFLDCYRWAGWLGLKRRLIALDHKRGYGHGYPEPKLYLPKRLQP